MGIYDLMRGIQQQGEEGRKRGLQALVGKAYAAPQDQRQQILNTVAQRGAPDMAYNAQAHFEKMDDAARQKLGQYALAFDALPDEQKAQAYPQFAQQAQALGIPAPTEWNPAFAPNIQKLAQALGGGGVSGNVQSTYIDAQGNRVAIMRDGSTQVLGQNAPSNQIIDTGNGFFGVNKGNLQAAPVMMGGQAPQRAPGEVPFSIDPSLPPEVQASIRQNESAFAAVPDGGSVQIGQQGQQLRSAPKEPPPITPYQQAQLGMQQQRLSAAQDARSQAEAAKKAAEQVKAEQKRQVAAARQAEAATAANTLVSAIDQLMASPGFDALGTVGGDVQIATPLIRNAAKDANAQLQNIGGQVALSTMARLKALSSQGATGFGALSAPELKLLQNAIATLQSGDISNELLRKSLKTIRDTVSKVSEWKPQDAQQSAAPESGGATDPLGIL